MKDLISYQSAQTEPKPCENHSKEVFKEWVGGFTPPNFFIRTPHYNDKMPSEKSPNNDHTTQMPSDENKRKQDEIILGTIDDAFSKGKQYAKIPKEALGENLLIAGAEGYGINELITNIETQFAEDGHGMCFVAMNNDSITELLENIPSHRMCDVAIYGKYRPPHTNAINNSFDVLETPEGTVGLHIQTIKSLVEEGYYTLNDDLLTTGFQYISQTDRPLEDIFTLFNQSTSRFEPIELNTIRGGSSVGSDVLLNQDEIPIDAAPGLRRLQDKLENKTVSDAIANRTDPYSLYEAINSGKIIIGAFGEYHPDERRILSEIFMSKIYSVLDHLPDDKNSTNSENITPVIVDGIDDLNENSSIIEKFAQTHSDDSIPFIVRSKYFAQHPQDRQQKLMGNIKNTLCFNQSNKQTANELVQFLSVDRRKKYHNIKYGQAYAEFNAEHGRYTGMIHIPQRKEKSRNVENVDITPHLEN